MKIKLIYIVIFVVLASLLVYTMNHQLAYLPVAVLIAPLWVHLLMDRNYRRGAVQFLRRSTPILLAFLLYIVIQIFHFYDEITINELLFVGGYFYFFLSSFFLIPLIINSDNKFDIKRFFVGLGTVVTGIALLGYVVGPIQVLGTQFITYRSYNFFSGTLPGFQSILSNPNTYGSIIMICLFSSLFISFKKKSLLNRYSAYSIFLFFGFLFSFARASYFGMVIAVILSFLTNRNFRRKSYKVLLIGSIVLVVLVLCGVNIFKWASPFLQLDKPNPRLDLWAVSWQRFLDHPLIGWGQRDLAVLLAQYIEPRDRAYGHGPHNTYLRLILSGGITGFTAYGFIYLSSLIKSYKLAKKGIRTAQWIFPLLSGLLVLCFFETRTPGGAGTTSLIITMLLGWSRLLYIKMVNFSKKGSKTVNAVQKNE